MSEVPPDIAVSAAQTGFQAREASKNRDAQRAGEAHAAQAQTRHTSEVGDIVETSDDDVAVFADAEGTGSQGRPFSEEEQSEELPPKPGVTRDDKGQWHVDLEA